MRYIVTSLTDGGSLDLCGEDLLDDDLDDHEVREAMDDDWQLWYPDSVYARPKPSEEEEEGENCWCLLLDVTVIRGWCSGRTVRTLRIWLTMKRNVIAD